MKRKELTQDVKLIKKCRKTLIDLYSSDINKFIDIFFYEKGVKLENDSFQILEQAGILRKENKQWFANVMVFPFKGKLIVTDFLLSLYKKKNGKFTRGLDDVWVMFPHETLLFIDRLDDIKGKVALDMASGSGAISLFLADRFEKVIASDINPKAVKYARFNVVLNNLEGKITNVQSDLFSALKDIRFDYICWNGPTVALPEVKEPEKVYPLYTYGGPDGAEFTKKFLDEVFTHVNDKFKIKWWDGSLGDSSQSVVEQYIRKNLSKFPIKVTIDFLNKRRGVPLREYDRLYKKYCLDKFDLNQGENGRTKIVEKWYEMLRRQKLLNVYISLISIEPNNHFEVIYKETDKTYVGPRQVYGFEWHYTSRRFITNYLRTNSGF
ncbi:MAG: methyltransferase [Candidatus Levyibacteriota bacterium]